MTPTEAFRRARQVLLEGRDDPARTAVEFRWPELTQFNWAWDWFDVLAAGETREALRILTDPAGMEEAVSFAELSDRSRRVARHLHDAGVRKGDRLLLMLTNVVPLWETVLAAIRLGVVVIPATAQLTPADVADRINRGEVRHVVTDAEGGGESEGRRLAHRPPGGRGGARLHLLRRRPLGAGDPSADSHRRIRIRSSSTSPRARHGEAEGRPPHARELPRWAPLHDVLARSPRGRRAPEHQLSGVGEARLVKLLRALERRGNDPRARASAVLGETIARGPSSARGAELVRAPNRVRMLILEALGGRPETLRELASAGEPLNPEVIETVSRVWGLTIRDGYVGGD